MFQPATFLVTGSTDGIGLLTVHLLAKLPTRSDDNVTVIGIHGRCPKRIQSAVWEVNRLIPEENRMCFQIKTFCYDLSDVKQVQLFVDDVIKKFTFDNVFKLDVLINNAALFDDKGPRRSPDGRFELTFSVNVIAVFIITYKLLHHAHKCNKFIYKVINTASISHKDCSHHLKKLDYENLQFENGLDWTSFSSYGLSKLLVIMATRGFFYHNEWRNKIGLHTCLINMDPGTVNTKMLLAGWGACGMPVNEATDTFQLATDSKFYQPNSEPKYYVHLRERNPTALCSDKAACVELFQYLENICRLK